MPTVEEIQDAVADLNAEEFERFSVWYAKHQATRGAARPAAIAQDNAAEEPSAEPAQAGANVKYPHVTVRLKDLGSEPGPIIRRVSYALSDAGIGDDEIEQYKSQARAAPNPVAVTRRWVAVQ
ncbi:MAG: hypothetical protein FJX62_08600 [Alphaproteobacteria bacterium]|nr:hypothetical protein [Alphaproteobacteria bacterium]